MNLYHLLLLLIAWPIVLFVVSFLFQKYIGIRWSKAGVAFPCVLFAVSLANMLDKFIFRVNPLLVTSSVFYMLHIWGSIFLAGIFNVFLYMHFQRSVKKKIQEELQKMKSKDL